MLVFGVSVVVALNVAARLDQPGSAIEDDARSENAQYQIVRLGPGGAVSGISPAFTPEEIEDAIYSRNMDRLQLWSILSVVGLAVASGVGGYVLSGMMLRPVRDITRVASQISATDLSHRINHQGPEDELKELADTFDSMIDRIEQSFVQQRQFIQDASHELRTPLAAIRTNIEVAEMDASLSPEEVHDLLETIKLQTERLTRLSEDLLLLSSSEREAAASEPVNVEALANEVVRQLVPLAAQRKVVLRTEGDPWVESMAVSDHLYRSVFNLVDNAIKYSGEGAGVTIRWSPGDRDQVKITVADTGRGIPLEAQEHIFDRFYRVDKSRSRREGGIGLGLAIVRELVESMGGKVSLVSAPGEGSAFTITLPLAEPRSMRATQPSPSTSASPA